MSSRRECVRYWLPVALWMGFIFWGSTDVFSGAHTSRIIGPLLRWMFPGIANETLETVQIAVRKTGHAAEYALLAALIWRARFKPGRDDRRPWARETALSAWALALAYAVSDEWHQSFVASREGTVRDVAFDAIGAGAALWAIAQVWRRRFVRMT